MSLSRLFFFFLVFPPFSFLFTERTLLSFHLDMSKEKLNQTSEIIFKKTLFLLRRFCRSKSIRPV